MRHRSMVATATLCMAWLLVAGSLPTGAADPSAALRATPELLDYGKVDVDTDFEGYFTVRNVSAQPVSISSFSKTVPAGMTLWMDNGCSGTVEPGSTCSIRVNGYVHAYGTFTATLRVFSDDPASPLAMQVRASIDRPPAPPPVMVEAPHHEKMLQAFLPPKRLAGFKWVWAAKDDENLSGFTVQTRTGSDRWRTVVKPSRPVNDDWPKAPFAVRTGGWVKLRARPHDTAGKGWAWATSAVKVDYRDIRPGSSLRGKWKRVPARGAYGGSVVVADKLGPTASITVKARGIAILGRKGRQQGGVVVQQGHHGWDLVDLGASSMQELQVLHTWYWDTVATRTVRVTAYMKVGRPKKVALDAWVIVR